MRQTLLIALCAAALSAEEPQKEQPKYLAGSSATASTSVAARLPRPVADEKLKLEFANLQLRATNLQLEAEILKGRIYRASGVSPDDYDLDLSQMVLLPRPKAQPPVTANVKPNPTQPPAKETGKP